METWTDEELDHIAGALSVYRLEWGFSWQDWKKDWHAKVEAKVARLREALGEPSEEVALDNSL